MTTNQSFYIKFFAPILPESIAALMQIVDSKLKQGAKKLGLLISTPGGDVFHGLSAYNFLKGLQIDMGNIARVIADTVKKDKDRVLQDMLNRTTLYPEQALEYGLVHEIKSELFPPDSEVISIQTG